MRRKERKITDAGKIREILGNCAGCRLGLCDQGRAYIVPMNFGFTETEGQYTLYFHSAKEGRKIDLLKAQGWASFQMDTGYQLKSGDLACDYTSYYQCIMGGGPVTFVEDPAEKRKALSALMDQAAGHHEAWTFSDARVSAVCIFRLEVQELSCKANH